MSETFNWCQDKTRLAIWNKQVFHVNWRGDKRWYLNGEYHRENGPTVEYNNGDKYWYLVGKLHRVNGPAVEYANGYKEWYLVGKLHRVNGPAVEYINGYKAWYFNGRCYSESDYWKELKK